MKKNNNDLSLFKKERPLTYKIYDYLKNNCVGYSKRAKSSTLMKEFNIRDNKTLRSYIEDIRDSEILQKIICSQSGSKGGYWIATNDEDVEDTLKHLYLRSMKMLKTYSTIKNKARLNNQTKIAFGKYEKDIYKSIIEQQEMRKKYEEII